MFDTSGKLSAANQNASPEIGILTFSNFSTMKALLSLALIGTLLQTSSTRLQSQKFAVEIWQEGKPIEIIDHVVTLDRSEFVIKIDLIDHEGVFMNSCFESTYFDLGADGEIEGYDYLSSRTRAEHNFNENKELSIHDQSFSYLFYDPKMDWHRFDKDLSVEGKTVKGTKTVRQVHVEKRRESQTIALADLQEDIYLFFLATGKWKYGKKPPKEYGRQWLRITWK